MDLLDSKSLLRKFTHYPSGKQMHERGKNNEVVMIPLRTVKQTIRKEETYYREKMRSSWFRWNDKYVCRNCEISSSLAWEDADTHDKPTRFCPDCGAEMAEYKEKIDVL